MADNGPSFDGNESKIDHAILLMKIYFYTKIQWKIFINSLNMRMIRLNLMMMKFRPYKA